MFLLVVEVEDGEMYSVSEELVSGSCIFEVGFERWKRVLPRGVLYTLRNAEVFEYAFVGCVLVKTMRGDRGG